MNKLAKKLESKSSYIYVVCLLVFAAVALIFFDLLILALAEAAAALVIFAVSAGISRKNQRELIHFIESVTYEAEDAKNNTMLNFPLPMATYLLDSGRVVWGNQEFFALCGRKEPSFDANIAELAPNFQGKWLLEGKKRCPELVEVNGRRYQVHGNLIRGQEEEKITAAGMGVTYWVDVTDYDEIKREYAASRPVVMLILLDNYDEMVKNAADRVKTDVRNQVEDKLSQWTESSRGLLRRFDRDRYLFLCERRQFDKLEAERFSIVESVHDVVNISGIHATVSVGVGIEGASLAEDMDFASMSVEMALSRGGDQAVVRNRMNFEFYGGRESEVETRTKVKSRVVANALGSIMQEASVIFIMGHRFMDMDSLGAAAGLCYVARNYGKKVRIVMEGENACEMLVEELKRHKEYADVFINSQDAMLQANTRSLLIVVDTGRPEQVEDAALLQTIHRIVVIDHHRRAASYIDNAALMFYEPYASSVCELVVEIIEELSEDGNIPRFEAEALLAGIVTDTKNFTLRTGERTFDAAAFLRRAGADPISIKRLLQNDFQSTISRYEILEKAELYQESICIAAMDREVSRVAAAQAADEMLNILGVDASVVLYPTEDGQVIISARSIGSMNVQLLMERLGGGGNASAAGVQMKGATVEEALAGLKAAIDDYLS